jgi:thymidylate synthase
MTHPEYQYLKLMYEIIKNGKGKKSRGVHGIRSTFGYQMRFDLRHGFPLLTTKKLPFKILLHELFWFISGDTNIKYLNEHKIHYWDDFADKNGDLGPVYGYQWRKWPTFIDTQNGKTATKDTPKERLEYTEVDQLQKVIDEIKTMPDSKAMIVTAHNPAQLSEMRLPPCHAFYQFNVTKGKLKLQLYQRSSDVFLGLPFNIAQYAMILMMVGILTGYEARELVVTIGDGHLYYNHIEPAKEQLKRKPNPFPTLKINPNIKNINDFKEEDFELIGYKPHPHIKAPLVIL